MKMGIGRQAALGAAMAVALLAGPGVRADEGHGGHEKHGGAPAATKAEAQPAADTLTGEVLDLACYMGHEAKGGEHRACATKCLLKGVAPGLLTADGAVYLLVEDHKYEKVFKAISGLAAEQVQVTGKKVTRGGLQVVIVTSVKKI